MACGVLPGTSLRRAAVERADIYAADRGSAAHPAVGGSRDRQHRDVVRGTGGISGLGRAPAGHSLDWCRTDSAGDAARAAWSVAGGGAASARCAYGIASPMSETCVLRSFPNS